MNEYAVCLQTSEPRRAQVMGACHGIEILPVICPDIARDTASDIANFVIG
jgi:acetyl esterase